jgi:Ca2+-binding EF-hand superfamily protein
MLDGSPQVRNQFREMDIDKSGGLDHKEFAQNLADNTDIQTSQEMFDALDKNKTGE